MKNKRLFGSIWVFLGDQIIADYAIQDSMLQVGADTNAASGTHQMTDCIADACHAFWTSDETCRRYNIILLSESPMSVFWIFAGFAISSGSYQVCLATSWTFTPFDRKSKASPIEEDSRAAARGMLHWKLIEKQQIRQIREMYVHHESDKCGIHIDVCKPENQPEQVLRLCWWTLNLTTTRRSYLLGGFGQGLVATRGCMLR